MTARPETRRPTPGFTGAMAVLAVGCAVLSMGAVGQDTADLTMSSDSVFVQYVGSGGVMIDGPMGVAVDPGHHEIALASTAAGRVEYFDARGRSLGSFTHTVEDSSGARVTGHPRSLAIDPQGRLLVSDINAPYVDVCDFRGVVQERITLPAPDDRLTTGGAGAIAIAPDGRIFIASRARAGRVHVFSADHRWLATWGDSGSAAGRLSAISGLAVAPDGRSVVVTCIPTQFGIQVFDDAGHYVRGFGVHDIGPGNVSQPTGVTVTSDGRIWVVDSVRANIQVFDSTGTLLGVVGGGEGSGPWLYPSALATDGRGAFALAELGGNRMRLLWVR